MYNVYFACVTENASVEHKNITAPPVARMLPRTDVRDGRFFFMINDTGKENTGPRDVNVSTTLKSSLKRA